MRCYSNERRKINDQNNKREIGNSPSRENSLGPLSGSFRPQNPDASFQSRLASRIQALEIAAPPR